MATATYLHRQQTTTNFATFAGGGQQQNTRLFRPMEKTSYNDNNNSYDHDGETARRYRCGTCGRAYATARSLYRHRSAHSAAAATTAATATTVTTAAATATTAAATATTAAAAAATAAAAAAAVAAAAASTTDHWRCGSCGGTFAGVYLSAAGGRPFGWCARCHGWRPSLVGDDSRPNAADARPNSADARLNSANARLNSANARPNSADARLNSANARPNAAYACSECDKTYRSERALKRHALSIHGEGRQRFECDACDKTFASNYTLQRHLVLARCAGKPCDRCTNASCKNDRKSAILRRVFAYVLSKAVGTR